MTNGYNDYIGYDAVCKSHYSVINEENTSKRICRHGDTSVDKTLISLKRPQGAGEICRYYTYTDYENPGVPVEVRDFSKCGFNKDSAGWCSLRKGDKPFTQVLEQIHKIDWNDINCHVDSQIENCLSFKQIETDLQKDFKQVILETASNFGFSMFANNAKCVAESITASFWQGREPDSSYLPTMNVLIAISYILISMML
mmetsp:Transcript_30275/g.26832  ORF Transcript_30275/g.26832 Transcript_30275/m.26832 type:complete len:199 (+) Transcript_30275:113-709(+)